jgi:myosin heavy chain 9/10/11/14
MSIPPLNGLSKRNNPFTRSSASPSPAPQPVPGRPKSAIFTSPPSTNGQSIHSRTQSFSPLGTAAPIPAIGRQRSSSNRTATPSSTTFAPQFIKTEDLRKGSEQIKGIEGENDFSGKRYVWLKDVEKAFVRGWVVDELDGGQLLVQCDDGSVSRVEAYVLTKMLTPYSSNERLARTASTKSIRRSSTRPMTWQS